MRLTQQQLRRIIRQTLTEVLKPLGPQDVKDRYNITKSELDALGGLVYDEDSPEMRQTGRFIADTSEPPINFLPRKRGSEKYFLEKMHDDIIAEVKKNFPNLTHAYRVFDEDLGGNTSPRKINFDSISFPSFKAGTGLISVSFVNLTPVAQHVGEPVKFDNEGSIIAGNFWWPNSYNNVYVQYRYGEAQPQIGLHWTQHGKDTPRFLIGYTGISPVNTVPANSLDEVIQIMKKMNRQNNYGWE